VCSRPSHLGFNVRLEAPPFAGSVAVAGLIGALAVGAVAATPLHDPTRPSGWQATQAMTDLRPGQGPAALRLQGVFSHSGVRTAMISGRRVAVGDVVGGAQVVAIGNNKVTLVRDGRTIELAAYAGQVKSPTQSEEVLR